MAVTECRKVTHDCLEETAGGWLWVMFAAGAGATDAEEDMMDEMWMDARREEVEGVGSIIVGALGRRLCVFGERRVKEAEVGHGGSGGRELPL